MKNTSLSFKSLKFLLIAGLLSIVQGANAQQFESGNIDINAGLGFGKLYNDFTSLPVFSFSVDYGLMDQYGPGVIGVGGMLGFSKTNYGWWNSTEILMGGVGTYHLDFVDGLDIYGGVMPYFIIKTNTPNSISPLNVNVGVWGGAKYFFASNLAVYGEFGYNVALLTFGLTYRIK